MAQKPTALEVIEKLGLEKSPTGGSWFKHIHSVPNYECLNCGRQSDRPQSTSFLYLLEKITLHDWHRFSSSLIWTFLGGDGAELSVCNQDMNIDIHLLSADVMAKGDPVKVTDNQVWQRVRTLGEWSLVTTTHISGFSFGQLEIAETGWMPKDGPPKLSFPAR